MDGSVYGIAYFHTMCQSKSIGVNQDRHRTIAVIGQVVAHELGHIFNMEHDDSSNVYII